MWHFTRVSRTAAAESFPMSFFSTFGKVPMSNSQPAPPGWLAILGPGMLIAATGVGAGDLATGALAGGKLGTAILWAVIVGSVMKWIVNEGLARWQLATGQTWLEGCSRHFGRAFQYLFLAYLVYWTFFVSAALMSACGATFHAIFPLRDPDFDRRFYGVAHSLVALLLARFGGYALFEKVMKLIIALMFVTVVTTAILLRPEPGELLTGLFIPTIPDLEGSGLRWMLALMGGIGGTVTIVSYGYWIREEGRSGPDQLRICRLDLAAGYVMTGLFGIGMVILGSRLTLDDTARPARLMVLLANELESALGPWGTVARWAFLLGAWGAVASSMLGVWQAVPYLFADLMQIMRRPKGAEVPGGSSVPADDVASHLGDVSDDTAVSASKKLTASPSYRYYMFALATIPALGLWQKFDVLQQWYGIVGAAFVPFLALTLLLLNGRAAWVGERYRNRWWTSVVLIVMILFFAVAGRFEL